jgi:poly [ADP-ribose] polymerase
LFSTPCGIVSQDTLDKARDLLVVMSDYVKNTDLRNRKYINNLEEYLMLIPQKVGRKLDPESLYTSLADIRKQNDILDSLGVSLTTALSNTDANNPVEVEQKLFSCKLMKNEDSRVMKRLKEKFKKTLKRGHECAHLDIKTIFDVEIKMMKDSFEKHGSPIGNVMELWHGTRIFNVLSILKGGLHIPKRNAANVTGRMFGDGAYFSDISSKSLNYSYGYWDKGKRDNNCFMMLADVAMGKSYVPAGSYESLPKKGYDSTFAKPGKSGIQNNEMIVYNTNQCNITHLIEFSPDGK